MTFDDFCVKRNCDSCEFSNTESLSECVRLFELSKNRFKNKHSQDQIAMLIADWEHGELTECTCECENCPLNKELPVKLVGKQKMTMCNMLTEMSALFNEVEHD